jgi:hypothetical protein
MDDADAFSFLYEGEGEAVFFFLARRTMDAEVAVDLTAETSPPARPSRGPSAASVPALASGVTRGTITLRYSTGPSLDGALPTAKVRVGSFAVKIP